MKGKVVAACATVAILSAAYSAQASASGTEYIVKKGDTLSKISLTYKTTVKDLKTANGLQSDLIFINQKLSIPTASINLVTVPIETPAATLTASASHTVVKGDTLSGIALKNKTTVANLKKWNSLKSDLIYIAQKLMVSAPVSESAPVTVTPTPSPVQVVPVSAPAPAPAPASQKPQPANPASPPTEAADKDYASYTIKSGDTLGRISMNFNTTVSELKALNNLTSDFIRVGQVVKVPASKETQTAEPANAVKNDNLISLAKGLMGTPYAWGGSTPKGFDCSGFIYFVFKESGNNLNRHSSQGFYDRSYYVDKPEAGDLVFFENTYKKGISHMGIYIGDNQFIHASDKGVTITSLNDSYYKKHFSSFKRFY
ncbi:hypothetical protein A8F94_21350 [Bacillus sp. FJAT-27225]|uniref:C40 family peptidase n=1 Tax=Bacillus sp. FJAT-27225 TaxID=1743144 RepID=UPI00080C2B5C|nr:peptidoglycan endopeptidase [Bacillus sp. FJAT-27225]OCA82451.1 hypothetical protein A8F94_21350 [Bacillus sp. FJAT-27225]